MKCSPVSAWVAGAIVAAGCAANSANEARPALAATFQLRVGQSTAMAGVPLAVGFDAVIADSRCAKGEACVWEGDAIIRVWLQGAGGVREQRELHTASRQPRAVSFEGYGLRLVALAPYRISGRTIPPAAYVATLMVTPGTGAEDQPL